MRPTIKPTSTSASNRHTDRVLPKGWIESRLDGFLLRAAMEPRPWWLAITRWSLTKLALATRYFGRTFPYLWRPWAWLGGKICTRLDARRHETTRTIFLRRLFGVRKNNDGRFRVSYMLWNWLFALWVVFWVAPVALDVVYAYGTYPFGEYRDVVVTRTYRNITDESTYAIHGYQLENGEKKEVYLELGRSFWFWVWYPEFMFGQIPEGGHCTFSTYGISLRFFRDTRRFYVLNPWIVSVDCDQRMPLPRD